jgi:CBS domain-containing protein
VKPKENEMLVKECMTQQVELGRPDMTLREAARKMRDGDFGILPIAENDRLVGMITDRDITVRGTAEGKDPEEVLVSELMSKQVLYCYEDQSVEEVSENLGENQVRRLPVLNRQKRLVGILSLGDLAQSSAKPEKVEEALSRISQQGSNGKPVHA